MCDSMWDEWTDDIFDEITLDEALSQKVYDKYSPIAMYQTEMLKRLNPLLILDHFGKERKLKPWPENVAGKTIKFRRYAPLELSTEPLITGRVGTKWMLNNMWEVSYEDFYNQQLTEQDLKQKIGDKSMGNIVKEFKKEILQEIVDNNHDDFRKVTDTISETSRWSEHHEMVFKDINADKHYISYYSCGLTEYQEEQPYEYECAEIECREVVLKQVVTDTWVNA